MIIFLFCTTMQANMILQFSLEITMRLSLNSFIGRQMSRFRPIANCVPWKVHGPCGLERKKNKVFKRLAIRDVI